MISRERTDRILQRRRELEAAMATAAGTAAYARIGREYAEVEPAARCIETHRRLAEELQAAEALLDDAEMGELAAAEVETLRRAVDEAAADLRDRLAPRDELDSRPAFLEVRAAAGGMEAGLFAADLMSMYHQYAILKGWDFEAISGRATEVGGLREAVVSIRGHGVFARLKHEAGVHRVQRVPETESGGRIHTSTATVAVLPEPEEIEVDIPKEDLRIETMRASGAGGQHVNKTDSAVRITHVPTGISVQSSEKSQHRNRARAMQVLKARLFERQREETSSRRDDSRRGQIGSGDRSERIRTYNFPQSRVTDHRIGLTLHNLQEFMAGTMDCVIDELMSAERAARLAAAEA